MNSEIRQSVRPAFAMQVFNSGSDKPAFNVSRFKRTISLGINVAMAHVLVDVLDKKEKENETFYALNSSIRNGIKENRGVGAITVLVNDEMATELNGAINEHLEDLTANGEEIPTYLYSFNGRIAKKLNQSAVPEVRAVA